MTERDFCTAFQMPPCFPNICEQGNAVRERFFSLTEGGTHTKSILNPGKITDPLHKTEDPPPRTLLRQTVDFRARSPFQSRTHYEGCRVRSLTPTLRAHVDRPDEIRRCAAWHAPTTRRGFEAGESLIRGGLSFVWVLERCRMNRVRDRSRSQSTLK